MGKFTVLAVDTFAGEVRDIERHECDTILDAYRKLGELGAIRVGVIILDEHDCVWCEVRPTQIEKMSHEQRLFYRHYTKREA